MKGFLIGIVVALTAVFVPFVQDRIVVPDMLRRALAGVFCPVGSSAKTLELLYSMHVVPALDAAFKLGVFDAITAAQPRGLTFGELAKQLDVSEKGLDALLVTLVTHNYVTEDPKTNRLSCLPNAGLSQDVILILQGWVAGVHRPLYYYVDSIRSGRAEGLHRTFGDDVPSLYHARSKDADLSNYWDKWMESFDQPKARMMMIETMMARSTSKEVGKFVMLDWCGNSGYNSIFGAETFPTLQAVVMDLPPQIAKADVAIKEKGLESRIQTLPCDLLDSAFALPAAKFDGVLMMHTIREWGEEQLRVFFKMIYGTLKPGGVVSMDMVSLRRRGSFPPSGVGGVGLFQAYFLTATSDEQHEHHIDDMIAMLAEAGFQAFEWTSLPRQNCELGSIYLYDCYALSARRP